MSFLKRMFATATPSAQPNGHSQPAAHSSMPASTLSPLAQQNAGRRELLRLVLRDTLNRTGIPTSWIGADLLAATSRGREPGIHVRLVMKHWDPRLMLHGVAFENAFRKRVMTLDPVADRWLLGISWQFALPDESNCPALPHPGIWTSSVPASAYATGEAAAPLMEGMNAPDPADLLGGSIVISGPAKSPDSSAARPAAAAANKARDEAKADLERLFAIRDQDMKQHAAAPPGFAATEPAGLHELAPTPTFAQTESSDLHKSFAKTDVFKRPGRG